MSTILTIDEAEALAMAALQATRVAPDLAQYTARALVLAERDGLASHGLARLPYYLAQARSGKIDAAARPTIERDEAVIRVDAAHGLAFPAVALGCEAAIRVARELGMAVVSVTRSHHFGVAGHAVEGPARAGFVALAFSNSPAAMAPWGGSQPLYGTDPIAFGAPRAQDDPLLIDMSLSHVARGKVMLAQKSGEAIPEGWALDAKGSPTTDAEAAMAGTMLPMGGAKGAALALMVELLTAGLAGANFAYEAGSMFDDKGPPPSLAHFILVIDPRRFAGDFTDRAEAMFAAMTEQAGVRLPGTRRFAARAASNETISVPDALIADLRALGARAD